jgi:RNA polymerase sigma factor (sigma-70 family)
MMHRYTDDELLEGLRQRRRTCIDYLYQEYYPVVRHYLKQNSGNHQDVEDLLQDTIIVLYQRCRVQPFILECTLKTYFMSVCRNLWLQRLERKYRLLYQADCEMHEAQGVYTLEDQELKEENLEQQRLFYKNLMQLPNDCRRLLQLYCLKVPYKEIARLMKYKDEIYVKTRKYSCKKLLRRKIMNDPECQQFLNYEGARNHLRLD